MTSRSTSRSTSAPAAAAPSTGAPRDHALPLEGPGDLNPLLRRIGDATVVCLGEASHGTHEYYAWRALLTRRLIEEEGFSFVAVEGDWPACHAVSCSVTGAAAAPHDPRDVLDGFRRWPTWMWANEEVVDFTRWLRRHNLELPPEERVGFHGLDVYSLWESVHAVLGHLREHHPEDVAAALEACRCLEPYAEDPQAYARATRIAPATCEPAVLGLLTDLLARHAEEAPVGWEGDAAFVAEQNARAAVGAEAYYRAMVQGGPTSWNVRDTHMADTLDRLVEHYGGRPGAEPVRAVVWEHNTHVGDARFTDMADAGMVNTGQLVRERYGEDATVLVGFGSHAGTVVAADAWGDPAEVMPVPPARRGSTEALLHEELTGPQTLFVFERDRPLPSWAAEERGHRAIGVVYHPDSERWGNYVPTVLGRRYDAFLWFDRTTALRPLHDTEPRTLERGTWPST